MRKLSLISIFIIAILLLACSKEEEVVVEDTNPITPITQAKDTLLLLNTISTGVSIPINGMVNSHVLYDNKLYILDDSITYAYDLDLKKFEIVNSNNSGISPSLFGYEIDNSSFIKDNCWYYLCHIGPSSTLLKFDFNSKKWELIQQFDEYKYGLSCPIVIYANNRLFIFDTAYSYYNTKEVFEYDFNNMSLTKVGSHNFFSGHSGLLSQSTFIFNGNIYIIIPYSQHSQSLVKVYLYDINRHIFEELNEYVLDEKESILSGVACLYEDKIIFGMGSRNGRVQGEQTIINSKFYYYDITKNVFSEVINNIPQASLYSQCCEYKNSYFIFGGYIANDSINHNILQLKFIKDIK